MNSELFNKLFENYTNELYENNSEDSEYLDFYGALDTYLLENKTTFILLDCRMRLEDDEYIIEATSQLQDINTFHHSDLYNHIPMNVINGLLMGYTLGKNIPTLVILKYNEFNTCELLFQEPISNFKKICYKKAIDVTDSIRSVAYLNVIYGYKIKNSDIKSPVLSNKYSLKKENNSVCLQTDNEGDIIVMNKMNDIDTANILIQQCEFNNENTNENIIISSIINIIYDYNDWINMNLSNNFKVINQTDHLKNTFYQNVIRRRNECNNKITALVTFEDDFNQNTVKYNCVTKEEIKELLKIHNNSDSKISDKMIKELSKELKKCNNNDEFVLTIVVNCSLINKYACMSKIIKIH